MIQLKKTWRIGHVLLKGHNVVINSRNLFDQSVKNKIKTYGNIKITATSETNDYFTGSLLDYC